MNDQQLADRRPLRPSTGPAIIIEDDTETAESVDILANAGSGTNSKRPCSPLGSSGSSNVFSLPPSAEPEDNEFFSFPCSPSELAEQRERFLVFLRILVKYLELQDKQSYNRVKHTLRDFARNHNRRDGLFLVEMYRQTKHSVNPIHWQTAQTFYRMFMARRDPTRAVVSADGS